MYVVVLAWVIFYYALYTIMAFTIAWECITDK